MGGKLRDIRPKPIRIVLDRERYLLFDLNALAALEDEYGSIDEALAAMEKGSVKAIRALIWAGLIHEDEDLTPEAVGKLVGLAGMQHMVDALAQALGEAMPESGPGNA